MSSLYYHKNKVILPIIVVTSIILAIFSYNYFTQTSYQIQDLASSELQTNSAIEINSISKILSNAIRFIDSNLERIATSPSIINLNISRAETSLGLTQNSTSYLTDGYYLLDQNGRLITFSAANKEQFEKYRGINLGYRDYFKIPKEKGIPYISTVIDSNDNVSRIFLSFPISNDMPLVLNDAVERNGQLNNNFTHFNGVVVASIEAKTLGNYLEKQLHPKFRGNIGFIDRDGTIIYSQNQSFIGKKYFGNEFQTYLKTVLKDKEDTFNKIINTALQSKNGTSDFNFENTTTTIAYQAVTVPKPIDDKDENGIRIGTVFITVPHTLANNVALLINNQKITNFFIIAIIASISVIMSVVLLNWNKILKEMVNQKTLKLKETVNDLKKANEDLKLHDKMQKEFINVAAHELRTPTQAISGNLELIEMACIPSILQYSSNKPNTINTEFEHLIQNKEKLIEFTEGFASIYRNSQRLEKLVNDILDVSRIESNRLTIHKEYFNLNEKVNNVIKDIYSKIQNSSEDGYTQPIKINFITKKDPIKVFADKIRIFEAISNLINNALKFSNSEPITITVDTDKKPFEKTYDYSMLNTKSEMDEKKDINDYGEMVIVSIKDRGKGIDPDILPRLFNKFISKSEQGTGLGLYITRNIIEAHGGKIWAFNNKDGKGATFSFSLPLYSNLD